MKQTLKEFKVYGNTYNLYFAEDQIKFNEEIRESLNLITPNRPSPEQIDITDIDIREYSVYKNGASVYYIHKSVIPLSWIEDGNKRVYQQAIIKAALVEVALNKNKEKSFVNFIYTQDKYSHREVRMLSHTILDRLDKFYCLFETKIINGVQKQMVRHSGTSLGNKELSKETRGKNRSDNNLFIRVLMYGPDFFERPLFDTLTRNLMENHTVYNVLEKKHYTVSTYTLHHALFSNGKSVNKYGKEPSAYLNKKHYMSFDSDQVNELLGCIALGEDGHKIIHATHREDDINGWINRYKRGECFWIPYHWISRSTYEQTTQWLLSKIEDYTEVDIVDYDDFIKLNSL